MDDQMKDDPAGLEDGCGCIFVIMVVVFIIYVMKDIYN
jgi:hypothetical protein